MSPAGIGHPGDLSVGSADLAGPVEAIRPLIGDRGVTWRRPDIYASTLRTTDQRFWQMNSLLTSHEQAVSGQYPAG